MFKVGDTVVTRAGNQFELLKVEWEDVGLETYRKAGETK